MEIHQLRYFCAIAHHGTFTRAALAEGVAQPSLSQQIQKLEGELGARLFDRLPKHAKLTSFGSAFLPKAKQILRELGRAKTELLEMTGHEKGDLTIGAIPTIAPYLFPRLLASFAQQHRSIAIRIVEDITRVLLDNLDEGIIDLALVALPVPGDKFRSMELFRESMYAVLPMNHALAARKIIKPHELKSEPFLLLKEGHCFRDSVISACRKSRLKPKVVFESGQFATILAMVSAGMGISAIPEMAVQTLEGCCYVPIQGHEFSRRIGAVMMRQHFETRAHQAFLQHICRTYSKEQRSS
jgi:LysR family hydrogen peroxide-inducible transcriptional activator